MNRYSRAASVVALTLSVLCLSACATGSNPVDPYENVNRSIYRFNKGADKVVLKPIATAYDTVTPEFVQTGISNVFNNIGELPTVANDLFQLKITQAGKDMGRFLINSTLGLGGLFDVAGRAGLARNEEDLGQTLGYWGVGSGPYLMLPLLGPSNPRDLAGRAVGYLDPVGHIDHTRTRNVVAGMRLVDSRAQLFEIEAQLDDALDEYAYVRDAYIQRRTFLINDGAVSESENSGCESSDPDDCMENW